MREPILITGAGGFVGGHLVARARERGLRVVTFSGDLREAKVARQVFSAHRPGAVVHLASCRRRHTGDPWELIVDELRMLSNVIAATAEAAPHAPVLVAGSASQYGLAGPEPVPESTPTVPVSEYGAVKCMLEHAALLAPLTRGVRVIWARSFNLVGPDQGLDAPVPGWANQIVEAERGNGGSVRTGDLQVVRDFLDVRDLADAYLALVNSDAQGPVNVGSGRPVLLREVVDALLASARVAVDISVDDSLRRSQDPPFVVADITRLRQLTGWQPTIDLRQSVADVLEQWRVRVSHGEAA
ncbi:MAG: NAD-dependent epimerase/dehydratase family protein [Solirubrobacteraceae bacterium]